MGAHENEMHRLVERPIPRRGHSRLSPTSRVAPAPPAGRPPADGDVIVVADLDQPRGDGGGPGGILGSVPGGRPGSDRG